MPSVLLEILASTKEAEKTLKNFQNTATNSLDNISGAFTAMKVFAAAAVSAFAVDKIFDGLKAVTNAAAEQENAINSLNVALASNGRYTDGLSKSLIAYSNEVQSTTGLDDALVLSQLALAQTYARSADEAKNLVSAAIQLSGATGKDLNTSVLALGKTLEGTEGSLGKMLPSVKGLTEAQLKHGDAIKYVLDKFGGVAEGKLNTFSGSVTKLQNSFEDVNKAIGKSIVENPALISIIGLMSKAVEKMTDKITQNQAVIGDWVTRAIKLAVSSIPFFIEVIRGAVVVIQIFANAFIFIKGIIVATINVMSDFASTIEGVVKVALYGAVTGILQLEKSFLSFVSMIPGSQKLFAGMGLDLSQAIENADKKIEYSLDQVASNFVKVGDTISANGAFDGISEGIELVKGLDTALYDVKSTAIALNKEIESTGTSQESAAKKSIVALNNQYKAAQMLLDVQAKLTKLGADNPLVTPEQAATFVSTIRFEADSKLPGFLGQLAGGINAALQGAEGATKLISGAIGTIAETLLPGIGSTVTSIATVLAKGPEFVKQMVKDFLSNIPDIINNIIDSLPAIFEAIIGVLGSTSFWGKMLAVWVKLAAVWTLAIEASGLAWNAVLTASGIVWESVLTVSGAVWQGVVVASGIVWEAAVAASAVVQKGASSIWAGVVAAGAAIWAGAGNLFSSLVSSAGAAFSGNSAAAAAGWAAIVIVAAYALRHEIYKLLEEMSKVVQKLVQEVGTLLTSIGRALSDLLKPIVDGFANLVTSVGTAAAKFIESILGGAVRFISSIINGIANGIGGAISKLTNAIRDFASGIVDAGKNFLDALLKGLADGIKGIFGGLGGLFGGGGGGGGIGGALGSVVSGVGNAAKNVLGAVGIHFAKGGVVPGGFNNDTYPAMLSSGEMVIPRNDVDRLSSFLDAQSRKTTQSNMDAIGSLAQSSQPITINLTVGEQDLASVMLNLNRRGFRTA